MSLSYRDLIAWIRFPRGQIEQIECLPGLLVLIDITGIASSVSLSLFVARLYHRVVVRLSHRAHRGRILERWRVTANQAPNQPSSVLQDSRIVEPVTSSCGNEKLAP